MPNKPSSKPTSKASKRAVSVDSTSSQERASITHELTGANGDNAGDNEEKGSQNEEGEDGEDDEEEVYEIEKILHHSKNMFVSILLLLTVRQETNAKLQWITFQRTGWKFNGLLCKVERLPGF
jgi:hypothetical protein